MENKVRKLTIFLGTYNAEPYLESLFEQIKSQEDQNFNLFVVDNNSSDNSCKILSEWETFFKQKFILIKNKKNIGVPANIYSNIEKINTPWFCNFHQDDFYKPNHISTINQMISMSGKDVVGVCTTMGSMSNEGKILNSKPRVSWFSPNLDQPGQFLQNIKAQAVPYPAAAFRLDVFKKAKTSAHNPTFSDTEQTLKFLGYGKFIFSQKETMYYRENPESASHLLNSKERVIGAGISLSRIFNSQEFDQVLDKVPETKRKLFAKQLMEAIEHRLPESDLLQTTQILALEHIIEKWGYQEKSLVNLLMNIYKNFSSAQTVSLINNLNVNSPEKFNIYRGKQKKEKIGKRVWDIYFNLNSPLARKYNKIIVKTLYFWIFIFKPRHMFKNRWR